MLVKARLSFDEKELDDIADVLQIAVDYSEDRYWTDLQKRFIRAKKRLARGPQPTRAGDGRVED